MFGLIPYRYRNEVSRPQNSLFSDDFFRPFFLAEGFPEAFRVDVKDNGENYVMEAELPGLSKDQIHIDVDDGNLTITANWCDERKEKEGYLVNERRCGSVRRSFTLSDINEDAITAEYVDGILKLTLPKRTEAKVSGHRIEIQ